MTIKLGTITFITLLGLTTLGAEPITSPKPVSVEKIVDTEIITNKDVDNRIMLITSGHKETQSSFRTMVLETMAYEKILRHVAERSGIKISQDAINKTLENIAKNNNMTLEQMKKSFSEKGISFKALESMIKDQLHWREYLREKKGGTVHVSENEIDAALQKVLQNSGQNIYSYIEIFLPVTSKDQEEKTRANAEEVANQLRQPDVNASMIAQQFSKAASAQNGGKVTLVSASQIDPALVKTLDNLEINSVSSPVRTQDGFIVVKLLERQHGQKENTKEEEEVTLYQTIIGITSDSPEFAEKLKAFVTELTETRGCKAFAEKIKSFQGEVVIEQKRLSEFPPELSALIKKTPIGQCVPPIRVERGILIMMPYKFEKAKFKMPTRDDISHMLEEKKFRELDLIEGRRHRAFAHVATPQVPSGAKQKKSAE